MKVSYQNVQRLRGKEKKILEKFPEIQQCIVRIERNQEVEEMAKEVKIYRRSERIATTTVPKMENRQITKPNQTPMKKAQTFQQNVSKSMTKALKPIIKTGGMRSRSKSVSFDPAIVSPINLARRNLFGVSNGSQHDVDDQNGSQRGLKNGSKVQLVQQSGQNSQDVPMDLTTNGPSDVQPKTTADLVVDMASPSVPVQVQQSVASYVDVETETNDTLVETTSEYETRIKNLVDSNRAKIDRIKQLIAEKSLLLKDIDTLHNMNLSMATTIDAFRADDNNDENMPRNETKIAQLEKEVDVLRLRIDRVNRDHLDLIAKNKRMKICLHTYSKKVLAEHNYNM